MNSMTKVGRSTYHIKPMYVAVRTNTCLVKYILDENGNLVKYKGVYKYIVDNKNIDKIIKKNEEHDKKLLFNELNIEKQKEIQTNDEIDDLL